MKSENKILKIINEELKSLETEIDTHALLRLEQRLDLMSNNGDITQRENDIIRKNLDNIISHNFDPNISYGIFLGSFIPNPKSKLYTNANKFNPGISFYEIKSDRDELLKDSTGDEFWAIVRKNRIKTVMLRKRLQRASAHKDRMDDGGLGVDKVIPNFDNYLQQQTDAKQQQKEPEKQQEKVINIKGVLWKIDDINKRLSKKNNPNTFVSFDDVLDYPDWNDNTKEQILNILAG